MSSNYTSPGFNGDDYDEDSAPILVADWPNIFDAPEMTLAMARGTGPDGIEESATVLAWPSRKSNQAGALLRAA